MFALRSTSARTALSPLLRRNFNSSVRSLKCYEGVDAATFEKQVSNGSGIVLVDFYATWCGPCKVLTPTLKKVTEKANVDLVTLDVDVEAELAAKYSIRSLPTVMAFKDGQPISQFMGAIPEKQVQMFIDSVKEK
ncbi:hypothetical protein FFLO_03257 [Filobasidium floriforme]|uniref:Thioredoxin domain-containing protein n=1 Tax=Filobasidium floriforme TaxID=5210 RepID=A0A8K0JRG0_9TREE|nr:hypothetical protein FFLO_03257 [Filobasidium floriforme]